jgi:predicted glycosyltransferase
MLRRALCAVAVVAFSVTLACAAEIRGVITKVSDDGKTITVGKYDRESKTISDTKEYKLSPSVKILKGKREDKKLVATDEELKEGLKSQMFQNINEKRGVQVLLTTDDSGTVTQIVVGGRGKKKNQ